MPESGGLYIPSSYTMDTYRTQVSRYVATAFKFDFNRAVFLYISVHDRDRIDRLTKIIKGGKFTFDKLQKLKYGF